MDKSKIAPVTAILIGAGSRGRDAYGEYARNNPERLQFIAIAEPDIEKRKIFQNLHNIPDNMAFNSWEKLLEVKKGKIAQVAFICTPDRLHYKPAMKALELRYDLVLEKPIAPTLIECQNIHRLAEKNGCLVQICHVLRFTDFWQKIKQLIDTERLGKIIHYDHSENVSYWHFGHSFVRGSYKNKETSTAIILAKTCHDLDLIHWLVNEKAVEIHSVGEVTHYKSENAPLNAPKRCTDGCPIADECPWYAPRLYIDLEPIIRTGIYSSSKMMRWITKQMIKSKRFINFLALFNKDVRKIKNWDQFPLTSLTTDYSKEGVMKALQEGPFGLCIYKTGNDVPDHQISTFTFPSGATATLTMHGLSEHEGRELRIFGSKGVLRGIFRNSKEILELTDFRFGKTEIIHEEGLSLDAHGGGDSKIMDAFTAVILGEKTQEESNLTDISSAMESHYMGFAAEESRIIKKVQQVENFRQNLSNLF
ncbi:MAG TPA: Gfo/Idh/MocA family oxidoreductase [Candidatus Bathyarchaeia archaeon]|nr:Gfo/Idh/MocA family oxidoreductase [Candidatus Bathyarchaeia archaeon]